MEPQAYIALIGAVSRAVSLAIAAVGGICCIFLGWFLYRDGIKVATAGLIDHKDFKLKLTTSGPGVFLVAFGAGILVYLIGRPATFTMPEPKCPPAAQIEKSGLALSRPSQLLENATGSSEKMLIVQAPSPALKPAATTRSAECKPCRVWAVSFLEGAAKPDQYKAALEKGIALLTVARQDAQQKNDEKQLAELRDHIDRLRELRGNLNEK